VRPTPPPGRARAARARDWLRIARSRRFGSVCTGAFALAASGLLESRRLTTHWASVDALAQACPGVVIEPDSLYVRDGKLRTAAGVTAGLDLALASSRRISGARSRCAWPVSS
jgi:transcriptional regulator GlxA family with amidase domain